MRPAPFGAPVVLSLFLAACGGSDSPTSPGGNANNPGGSISATVKEDPSFASDIVPIFSQHGCASSGCHGSPGQAGLTLSGSPYNALVNVASTQTSELRVIPGNANDSYLAKKLEGRASVGQRMPPGGQLTATELANIKNWISKGAKNNQAAPHDHAHGSPGPPRSGGREAVRGDGGAARPGGDASVSRRRPGLPRGPARGQRRALRVPGGHRGVRRRHVEGRRLRDPRRSGPRAPGSRSPM